MSILGCYKSTQLCPSQFTSNPPNTIQPPQPITTHHNTWYSNHKINQKQRKIKQKINPNPKSNLQRKTQKLRTQNQTFNKKPINPNLSAWELRWRKRSKKKKKWREKIMGEDVEMRCDFVIIWWGLKVDMAVRVRTRVIRVDSWPNPNNPWLDLLKKIH